MGVFSQNSYTEMCFNKNKEFYGRCKALKLGVPLYLKDTVEWDTSFGGLGQSQIRSELVNV